jgi:hypothetical protein
MTWSFSAILKCFFAALLMISVSCNRMGKISGFSASSVIQNKIEVQLSNISVSEGVSVFLLLSFSDPAPNAFTLRWTLTGAGASTDFPVTTGTISVAKDAPSVSETISSNNNSLIDGIRNYTLNLESVDGTTMSSKTVSFSIVDDESPSIPSLS